MLVAILSRELLNLTYAVHPSLELVIDHISPGQIGLHPSRKAPDIVMRYIYG